ncbi:MAG: IS1634 family transposase, partial [Chitinophagaceae bacterium]
MTIGRLEESSQRVDAIMRGLSKHGDKVKAIEILKGDLGSKEVKRIGADMVVERIWEELSIGKVIRGLLSGHKFLFDVERAIYFTVLSRLFFPGSDRSAKQISRDYRIQGIEGLELHHLYRAMGWLGDCYSTVEEKMFHCNRTLFSDLNLVFFDTTSIYFEGKGGSTLGQYGYSKDHRSDERQMIVGAVLDNKGRPLSCPMWPGNTADVNTIVPVAERLKNQFGVGQVVIVADGGMISKGVEEALADKGMQY